MDATVEKASKGEREAMAKLVAEHYAVVFRFCARRVGNELAKDAAQETFITAHRQIKKFDERSSFSTWLLGIAHNHCRNLARKRKFEIGFNDFWKAADTPSETGIIDRTALRAALLRLSNEHREAVVMHEIEGLTYEEAAAILNVPVGTIKSRLHHAFLALRRALTPGEQVPA